MLIIKNYKQKQSGFTLLEMLIALSVFSVGIMAAFTLSLANVNTARDNYQRLFAANLAREGLELVKNIRDSNWLKIEANEDCDLAPGLQLCTWDQGLDYNTSTIDYDEQALTGALPDITDCFDNGTCRIYDHEDGFYDHDSVDGSSTNVARLIVLKAICMNDDGSQESIDLNLSCNTDPSFKNKIGLQVTSFINWYGGRQQHELRLVENMYNWRTYED